MSTTPVSSPAAGPTRLCIALCSHLCTYVVNSYTHLALLRSGESTATADCSWRDEQVSNSHFSIIDRAIEASAFSSSIQSLHWQRAI